MNYLLQILLFSGTIFGAIISKIPKVKNFCRINVELNFF